MTAFGRLADRFVLSSHVRFQAEALPRQRVHEISFRFPARLRHHRLPDRATRGLCAGMITAARGRPFIDAGHFDRLRGR